MSISGHPAPGGVPASGLVALDEDHHVHSTFSDDAVSTVAENVRAARERGLRVVVLADHVRQGSPWVPDFVAAVRELRPASGIEVLAGVEAKILNGAGELDLPPSLRGLDRVLIADHQYPGDHGPVPPQDMRDALERRQCSAADVIDGLIAATLGALERAPLPQLAHLFSLLPKMGLDEADVPGTALDHLARGCHQAGARVEVNEKWACPAPRTIRALAAAGVPLVASTDSHDCATSALRRVRGILAAVPLPRALMRVVLDVFRLAAGGVRHGRRDAHAGRRDTSSCSSPCISAATTTGMRARISRASRSWSRPGTRPRSSAPRSIG